MVRWGRRRVAFVSRVVAVIAVAGSAAVLGTVALAGCSSGSSPAPSPTPSTSTSPTSTSGPATTGPSTSGPSTTSSSAKPVPPRTSTLARYDVSALIGSNIYDFPVGRPGQHGGVLQAHLVGTNAVSVAGATGPVSLYLPCCTDSAHPMLDYQIGSTQPSKPTQIPIGDDQGLVLDGRLIAIHAILPVGTQPRVEAQVIVFPASAATGLPVVR